MSDDLIAIQEADFVSLADKLNRFGSGLNPREQAILAAVFAGAPEVAGFGGGLPTNNLNAPGMTSFNPTIRSLPLSGFDQPGSTMITPDTLDFIVNRSLSFGSPAHD